MSRRRNAVVTAVFVYLQYGLAIVTGFVLVPLTLRAVGAREYGLWLASGDLLAYASMVDLGILSVLPWMLAEADGRQDRDAMRGLIVDGLAVGTLVAAAYGAVAVGLWAFLPGTLKLTAADRAIVGPPLALLVAATVVGYPLRVFSGIIAGLQDVFFNGVLGVAQAVVNVGLTIALLLKGYGLYALAVGSAASSLFVVAATLGRTAFFAPDLLRGWRRPALGGVRALLGNGVGVWFGAFGWQLLAASNNMIIAFLGHPEWVPIYSCTAKLSLLSTQLAWVMPDSGLIGLAQLHGERQGAARVGRIVAAMLQLHLILAGGAACAYLAFNPAFVTRWVGAPLFGGLRLNTLLAIGIVLYSLVHGLVTAASVLGNRLQVGAVMLVNGALQVVCAVLFGRWWGLSGIAAAGLVTAVATAVPAGVLLLRPATKLTVGRLGSDVLAPWLWRAAPLAALAASAGFMHDTLGVWAGAAIASATGLAYLWQMRPLYPLLPLEPRWTEWLISLRLMPAMPATEPERL